MGHQAARFHAERACELREHHGDRHKTPPISFKQFSEQKSAPRTYTSSSKGVDTFRNRAQSAQSSGSTVGIPSARRRCKFSHATTKLAPPCKQTASFGDAQVEMGSTDGALELGFGQHRARAQQRQWAFATTQPMRWNPSPFNEGVVFITSCNVYTSFSLSYPRQRFSPLNSPHADPIIPLTSSYPLSPLIP